MLHQLGESIIEQYRIVDFLGEGLGGITYKALDLKSNDYVAIKVLSLQQMSNWKTMELFEREACILAQLKHPAIPEYLNYFQLDSDREKRWYLVQKFIPGQSLNTLVENGWRITEEEAIGLATQILEVLTYLHSFNPPVIHRDIKPQNIIRQSDGKVYLVDFGAVTDIYRQTLIGSSTIVGTYGYMPPEQFRGQVFPATDLYGLGATLLYLLTYSSPAEFPQKKLKIDFRPSINVSEDFGDWLETMLEPIVEDRFKTASEALAVLKGDVNFNSRRLSPRKPAHSKIEISKTRNELNLFIPHNKGEPGDLNNRLIIFYISLFLAALIFPNSNISGDLSAVQELIIRIILAIPFTIAELYFLFNYLYSNFGHTELKIDRENLYLKYSLFGFSRKIIIKTIDIVKLKISYNLTSGDENSIPVAIAKCSIVEGTKIKHFGRYIKRIEKEWLIGEINNFLDTRTDSERKSKRF